MEKTTEKIDTTPEQFEEFKKSFLHWRDRLGLTQYSLFFSVEELKKSYAQINVDEMSKGASIAFTKECKSQEVVFLNSKKSGLHECLHLLINRMNWLGAARYIENNDLEEENEAIVCRLEKVLSDESDNNQ